MDTDFEREYEVVLSSIAVPLMLVAIESEFYPRKLNDKNRTLLGEVAREIFERYKSDLHDSYMKLQTDLSDEERLELNEAHSKLPIEILNEIRQTDRFLRIQESMRGQI